MAKTSIAGLVFWILAILPGLIHPILVYIYFRRFRERTNLIRLLIDQSRDTGEGDQTRARERKKQNDAWSGRLDLDVLSFLFPAVITSLISVAGTVVIFSRHLYPYNQFGLPAGVFNFIALVPSAAATAGFAGAYVWGLYDFVDRFRILSLPASALHMIWFRLVLGAVMGEFASQLLAKDFAPVLVFALASIPVPAILKWMQDTATQRFSISGQVAVAAPQWELVQGLTPDVIARLSEAGVASVAHLGNQDPVRLLRSTNIEWRNILDMMDQAYLASYIGDGIGKIRVKGIRGSIEMAIIWQRLLSRDTVTRVDAENLVKSIAPDLGKDEASVRNLARNLWEDPQVDRIWSLWWQRDDNSTGTGGPQPGERQVSPDTPSPPPPNGGSDKTDKDNPPQ